MTDDEKIQAEVGRIMALPDHEHDPIVGLIRALLPDRRDQIVAYMRESTSGVTQRARMIANRFG